MDLCVLVLVVLRDVQAEEGAAAAIALCTTDVKYGSRTGKRKKKVGLHQITKINFHTHD